jgi:hypothetical protein
MNGFNINPYSKPWKRYSKKKVSGDGSINTAVDQNYVHGLRQLDSIIGNFSILS